MINVKFNVITVRSMVSMQMNVERSNNGISKKPSVNFRKENQTLFNLKFYLMISLSALRSTKTRIKI